ncbi:MAG: hypothetical protein NC223_02315 [Butyrivibrio sp.]|nr:hypothetical protein [Butyrivibrio sp.]
MLKKIFPGIFLGKETGLEGKTFVWTISSGIVYALQSLIFLAVITNLLGEATAGVYSVGAMIAQQMMTVGKFSVRNYQVSDVREKYSFGDYLAFRTATCLLAVFIMLGWIFFGGYRGERAVIIVGFTVYKLAECFSDLFEGLYQQKGRFDISGKSQFVKDFLMIIVFVAAVFITRDVAVSSVILAVVSVLLLAAVDLPLAAHFAKSGSRFKFKKIWELTLACFALFVSSFIYVYINNAPKYAIAGLSMPDAERDAFQGVFSSLFMPVFMVDLLASFTMRIWITKMALFHDKGDRRGFKRIVLKQVAVIAAITAASMLFMYLLGGYVLSLIYGIDLHGYEAENVLLMLAGGMVSIYTLFENVIIIYRNQQLSIVISIVSVAAAAVVVPICTQSGGILGACAGYLAVNTLRAAGYIGMAVYYMAKEKRSCASA